MKLKYYLRGLGTGIAVTALIIGISSFASRKSVMTDEEVMARAKELGMVERTVLSETVAETEEDEEVEPEGRLPEEDASMEQAPEESDAVAENETVNEEPEAEEPEKEEPEKEEQIAEESEKEEQVAEEPEAEEPEVEEPEKGKQDVDEKEKNGAEAWFGMPDEAGTIQFTIVRGDSSDSVSRRLEEAGLVDSAVDYDRYLCQNGYDKRIQTGNYEIPANATQEEIAVMITSR